MSTQKFKPTAHFLLLLVTLFLGACSAPVEPGTLPSDSTDSTPANTDESPEPTTIPPETAAPVGPEDALRQDAAAMAEAMGISLEEAISRLQRQDEIGRLGAALEQQEAETFAGLWIQHEPVYRVVVAFTENGEETIRPYVEGSPLAELIEIRTAEISYAELKAVQQTTTDLLEQTGLSFASSINIQENEVELHVTDRALFDATLVEAGIELPDHVTVITVYEPLTGEPPFPLTPDPTLHLPQLRTRSVAFMEALREGQLVREDDCLRISAGGDDAGHLIIWQPDYFVNYQDGVVEILDRDGNVVAREGELLRLGGGEVSLTDDLADGLSAPLPEGCHGPYWLMGEIVSSE